MTGIYKITSPSGLIYIGQSVDIKVRFTTYKSINKSKGLIKLFRSFQKYGIAAHTFEVIEQCLEEKLNERERFWQEYYDCVENGLNCFYTKTSDLSGRRSSDSRKRMSIAQKASPYNKLAWLGKYHTQESKDKISAANSGRKHSDEVNKSKGRPGRPSNRRGIFGSSHPRSRKIIQYSLDNKILKVWDCGMDIKRETDFGNGNICSCCKGALKTAYGYLWRFEDEVQ